MDRSNALPLALLAAVACLLMTGLAGASGGRSSASDAPKTGFYGVALVGTRITPEAGRPVRPRTDFVFPVAWRLAARSRARLKVSTANPRSGCRIDVVFRQSVRTGPAVSPLEFARSLLPIERPAKLYEEETRAQSVGRPASASVMTFDYSKEVERAVHVTTVGVSSEGRQTWLVLDVVSSPTRGCDRDNPLALIHHPAQLSTVLAGVRTVMGR